MQLSKVAVVIPVHNGGETLAATLSDLLEQTYTDFSVTIVENGSTDNTVEVARRFCAKDTRVSIDYGSELLPPVENFARAMQIGASRGTYFMLRACDDTSAPDYLEKLVHALDACPDRKLAAGTTRLVGGSKGERSKSPNQNVFDFVNRYTSGHVPRNLTFPAEWIYGLFRSDSAERLRSRWTQLGTPWCAASFALYDFVVHDEVAYVPDAYFEFVEGSGSKEKYAARGFRAKLRRRLDYSLGCFALRHSLPPVSIAVTARYFFMCWTDSRRKTGFKLLGFL
ncbi:glycosyltransferase family 2 protein [Thioclava sp.]|uniref:glycosyltransferase family 2 protein n=1 Tax=Thioclava sp. TaxID=1933450 RepID=UPI003AA9B875